MLPMPADSAYVSFNTDKRMLLKVELGKKEAGEGLRYSQMPRRKSLRFVPIAFRKTSSSLRPPPNTHTLKISQRSAALPYKISLEIIPSGRDHFQFSFSTMCLRGGNSLSLEEVRLEEIQGNSMLGNH